MLLPFPVDPPSPQHKLLLSKQHSIPFFYIMDNTIQNSDELEYTSDSGSELEYDSDSGAAPQYHRLV